MGERKRSLIDANTKCKDDPARARERMLLIQMLLNTDPLLPANLDKKGCVGKLSAVEMRRKSDDDVYPWVDTIVSLTLTLAHEHPTLNPTPSPSPSPSPNPESDQVATIVALAIDGGEPTMDGLVRLLDRAGLIRKAPLAKA